MFYLHFQLEMAHGHSAGLAGDHSGVVLTGTQTASSSGRSRAVPAALGAARLPAPALWARRRPCAAAAWPGRAPAQQHRARQSTTAEPGEGLPPASATSLLVPLNQKSTKGSLAAQD